MRKVAVISALLGAFLLAGFVRDYNGTFYDAPIQQTVFIYSTEIVGADIKSLATTPVVISPVPCSTCLIEFLRVAVKLTPGSEVMAESSDDLRVEYSGGGTAVSDPMEMTGFIDSAVVVYSIEPGIWFGVAGAPASSAGKALALAGTSSDFTGNASNDAVLSVRLTYTVHSF